MTSIAANLQAVKGRIASACAAAGRDADGVRLLAVSKTWPAAAVREILNGVPPSQSMRPLLPLASRRMHSTVPPAGMLILK
jgi:hypothetical protein